MEHLSRCQVGNGPFESAPARIGGLAADHAKGKHVIQARPPARLLCVRTAILLSENSVL